MRSVAVAEGLRRRVEASATHRGKAFVRHDRLVWHLISIRKHLKRCVGLNLWKMVASRRSTFNLGCGCYLSKNSFSQHFARNQLLTL